MANLSIKKTDERESRFRRLLEATGENTVAGAIDTAAIHYLSDKRNKELLVDHLTPSQIETLSTPQLPINVETSVGRSEE